jgi:hypothetical protein
MSPTKSFNIKGINFQSLKEFGEFCVNGAGIFGLHHSAFLNDKVNRLNFISTVSVASSPPDFHN